MITRVSAGESGRVGQGDAVFHWDKTQRYSVHVGICLEAERPIDSSTDVTLRVRGLPDFSGNTLGDDLWAPAVRYHVDVIGHMDVDRVLLKDVVLLSEAMLTEHSQFGTQCKWNKKMVIDPSRTVRDGIPVFVQGTCAHYVEYLYERVGLDIVAQADFHPPERQSGRIYPATQIHAFWRDRYPIRYEKWDARFEKYPDCLFLPE